MTGPTTSFFDIPEGLPREEEFFETLASGEGLRVERIISHGHTTAEGQWYDQALDEWVLLTQGEATLEWEDGTQTRLVAGSAVFIAAHQRHRVVATSSDPPCVWLAVHGTMAPT